MEKFNIKKLTLTALFAAVAVVGSLFSFPVFGAKCAPVQHLVNILCTGRPVVGACSSIYRSLDP